VSQSIVETEMRFAALEYMVNHLCVTLYMAAKSDRAKIDASHKELIERAGQGGLTKFDPAMSDAAAAAFQKAMRNLLNGQREMLGMPEI
jgi:hypothetical protein